MLAALVVYFFLGGGGASGPMLYMQAAAENIDVAVLDEVRRERAATVVESMLDRSKDHNKALDDLRGRLADVVSRHDVTADEIDALWVEYFESDAQYSDEIIDLRFDLKDELTREEWTAIFSSAPQDTNKS